MGVGKKASNVIRNCNGIRKKMLFVKTGLDNYRKRGTGKKYEL